MAASRVTVHFPCPVERVWQTVTDPNEYRLARRPGQVEIFE